MAKKVPEVLTTRRLSKYIQGIELAFGAAGCQIQIESFEREDTKRFTRFWLRMQNRRKIVLHNLKLINMAELVLHGWMDYYNYLLNQKSLYSKTPSQAAEIQSPSIPKPKAKSIIEGPNTVRIL